MAPAEMWNYLLILAFVLAGISLALRKPAEEGSGLPELELEEVRHHAGGRCLVCRDALAGELVECRSCRTPHHRDCWDYVGSCSLYGCETLWCTSLEVRQ